MLHPQLHSETTATQKKKRLVMCPESPCDKHRDSKPKANELTRAHAQTHTTHIYTSIND